MAKLTTAKKITFMRTWNTSESVAEVKAKLKLKTDTPTEKAESDKILQKYKSALVAGGIKLKRMGGSRKTDETIEAENKELWEAMAEIESRSYEDIKADAMAIINANRKKAKETARAAAKKKREAEAKAKAEAEPEAEDSFS